jgi:hypothetical protein
VVCALIVIALARLTALASAVPGQIALGHLSDRIGREWVWDDHSGGESLPSLIVVRS